MKVRIDPVVPEIKALRPKLQAVYLSMFEETEVLSIEFIVASISRPVFKLDKALSIPVWKMLTCDRIRLSFLSSHIDAYVMLVGDSDKVFETTLSPSE
jgi:hypothetical protein